VSRALPLYVEHDPVTRLGRREVGERVVHFGEREALDLRRDFAAIVDGNLDPVGMQGPGIVAEGCCSGFFASSAAQL